MTSKPRRKKPWLRGTEGETGALWMTKRRDPGHVLGAASADGSRLEVVPETFLQEGKPDRVPNVPEHVERTFP